MATPIEPLVQFVNHGFLPFAGRDREQHELLAFAAGLASAESLRVALVTGEGGIGKSRLFEEALPGLIAQGGCIVRAKLHADTAGTLVDLLADSLWRSEATRAIIKSRPESSATSVLHLLRRLARLRQLIVVVEDIHLLGGASLEAFAALVNGLSDEPVGMLLSARPVTLDVRGIIEPHIHLNIELAGLDDPALQSIWTELFGDGAIEVDVKRRLLERTAGNPLALRMALRSAVRSESVDSSEGGTNLVRLLPDLSMLERSLRSTTRLLAEGMVAHLSEEEREWAGRLAWLGEIVSPEAARILLDGSEEPIRALQAKGVLAESGTTPATLSDIAREKSLPLVFTHTLVHRHFLEQTRFDINRFWRVLSAAAPLYSLTPFEDIPEKAGRLAAEESLLLAGLNGYHSLLTAAILKYAPDSIELKILWRGYEAATAAALPQLQGENAMELRLNLLYLRVNLFRYVGVHDTDERREQYIPLLQSYRELAEGDLPLRLLHHRLFALGWTVTFTAFTHLTFDQETADRIEAIVEREPSLRVHRAYLSFQIWVLRFIVFVSMRSKRVAEPLLELLTSTNKRVQEIVERNLPDLYSTVDQVLIPMQIQVFRTPDELDYCRMLLDHYERRSAQNWNYHLSVMDFLVRAGNIEVALQHNRDINRMYASDAPYPFYECYWQLPQLLTAINTPLQEISEIIRRAWNRMDPVYHPGIAHNLHGCGALRGDTLWGDQLFMELMGTDSYAEEQFAECLFHWYAKGVLAENHDTARRLLHEHVASGDFSAIEVSRFNRGSVVNLALFVYRLPDAPDEDAVEAAIRLELLDPLCDTNRFEDLVSTLTLLSYAHDEGISSMRDRLCPEIRVAVTRTMNWLVETRRIIFARVFPERFPDCFTRDEWKGWLARIDSELEAQNQRLRPNEELQGRRVQISMLGTVRYRTDADAPFQGIKGIRLKQLLGLMTLSCIVPRPLGRAEFFAVVADPGADDEARRNTVKVAVYQLRKLLGPDSILQGEETPRLNLDVVQVDMVDVWNAIQGAESAFSSGLLKNAASQIFKVLRILNCEVPFPTLYDPIFESAREDIEIRLRKVILNTCGRLLDEGDEETSEAILRQGVRQLSGDEDLEDELLRVLHAAEKRLDAVRMATT